LDWFKGNVGRALEDACQYICKPHNQYARDFTDDNPLLGMKDARKFWALKKKLPSEIGCYKYERSDLQRLMSLDSL
jgi:hypothetical protein